MQRRPAIAGILLTLLLASCAARPPHEPDSSIVTTLYFGLVKGDGSTMPDAEWQDFVDGEITTRFPGGFTLLEGRGAWQSGGKTTYEPSRILMIVRPDRPEPSAAINEIRAAYCVRFGQESVLRVDQDARLVAFK